MSEDSKKIVGVVAGTLVTAGLAILVGAWLMQGHDVGRLTYQQAAEKSYPDPTVFKTVVGKNEPGLDLAELLEATPQALARGKKLFTANCAACHGTNGMGDGPAAAALNPHPRNFTSPKGWTRGYTLADIYTTLSEGVTGTAMAAFSTLSPQERFALAHYVQSFGHFDHHDVRAEDIERLNAKFHLSQGEHTSNKVAVPTVMKDEAAEFVAPPAVEMPKASDTSAGAVLCRRLIADPVRAAQMLSEVPGWRKDLHAFAEAAMADTPRNGFRSAVATLDRAQWTELHDALVARTPRPREASGADAN